MGTYIYEWRKGMGGVSKQALIGVRGDAVVVEPEIPPIMQFSAVTNTELIALLEDF